MKKEPAKLKPNQKKTEKSLLSLSKLKTTLTYLSVVPTPVCKRGKNASTVPVTDAFESRDHENQVCGIVTGTLSLPQSSIHSGHKTPQTAASNPPTVTNILMYKSHNNKYVA